MQSENALLWAASALYLLAAALAVIGAARGRDRGLPTLALIGFALALHALSIGLRWERLGHGPYVDLFEILSSNVWSLHAVLLVATLTFAKLRGGLPLALPALSVLVLWMLSAPIRDTVIPVTYDTIWLPIHMVLGKMFLGLTIAATGLALVVIARDALGWRLSVAPPSAEAESLAYRVMLVAITFQTLMLVAGAAWARDAWGRYWSWDPLESWAFLTWLAAIGYLHWRPRRPKALTGNSAMVVGIYVLAFLTFFGVPFLSIAPHKGAV